MAPAPASPAIGSATASNSPFASILQTVGGTAAQPVVFPSSGQTSGKKVDSAAPNAGTLKLAKKPPECFSTTTVLPAILPPPTPSELPALAASPASVQAVMTLASPITQPAPSRSVPANPERSDANPTSPKLPSLRSSGLEPSTSSGFSNAGFLKTGFASLGTTNPGTGSQLSQKNVIPLQVTKGVKLEPMNLPALPPDQPPPPDSQLQETWLASQEVNSATQLGESPAFSQPSPSVQNDAVPYGAAAIPFSPPALPSPLPLSSSSLAFVGAAAFTQPAAAAISSGSGKPGPSANLDTSVPLPQAAAPPFPAPIEASAIPGANLASLLTGQAAASHRTESSDQKTASTGLNKPGEIKGVVAQIPGAGASPLPDSNFTASAVALKSGIAAPVTGTAIKPSGAEGASHKPDQSGQPSSATIPSAQNSAGSSGKFQGGNGNSPAPVASPTPVAASPAASHADISSGASANVSPSSPLAVPSGQTGLDAKPAPAAGRDSSEARLPDASAPVSQNPAPNARFLDSSAGQSEMHIDLRSPTFGNVEVHTTVRESQIGLAVGSDKGDLHSFLTAEVPSLQAAFRQQDLRFDQIHFLGQGGAASGFSAGTDSHSGFLRQGRAPLPAAENALAPSKSNDSETATIPGSGLNVHA